MTGLLQNELLVSFAPMTPLTLLKVCTAVCFKPGYWQTVPWAVIHIIIKYNVRHGMVSIIQRNSRKVVAKLLYSPGQICIRIVVGIGMGYRHSKPTTHGRNWRMFQGSINVLFKAEVASEVLICRVLRGFLEAQCQTIATVTVERISLSRYSHLQGRYVLTISTQINSKVG